MSQPPQPPRPGPPSRPPGPPGAGPPSGNFIHHKFFLRWNTSASFFSLKIYCKISSSSYRYSLVILSNRILNFYF